VKGIIIILFVLSVPIYASGSRGQPMEYVDLGELKIQPVNYYETIKNYYEKISLPYVKPKGVKRIPFRDSMSIILLSLVVDGNEVRRKRLFLSEKWVDYLYVREAGEEEENRFMEMGWYIERSKTSNRRITGLEYISDTGNTGRREQYIIPYGSKEVFLTYRIRIPPIPIYSERSTFDIFYTELQTVKWTIVWE
jgi:hypothetical protein